MKRLYRFLTSLRLTVVVLLAGVVFAAAATFFPQQAAEEFYLSRYGTAAGRIILTLGLDRFASSPVFIAIVLVFLLNLFLCTANRLSRALRRFRGHNFGPDLIHIGFLILMIGGLSTFLNRKEAFFFMEPGQLTMLPGGYALVLEDFSFLTYDDGRPKDWISTLTVMKNGAVVETRQVEVNRPLKIAGMKIYQASYRARQTADGPVLSTGLHAVVDPGFLPVAVSFFVILTGLSLTVIHHLRRKDI